MRSPVTVRCASLQSRNATRCGELAVVGVAREQRAGLRVDLGDDVRQVRRPVGAEHQLEEAR